MSPVATFPKIAAKEEGSADTCYFRKGLDVKETGRSESQSILRRKDKKELEIKVRLREEGEGQEAIEWVTECSERS